MEHRMKLKNKPFELIKSGKKKQELRLYDEKRKLIEVGDTILFTNIDTQEELGYKKDEECSYKDMEEYYSEEEQEKYGVVAIEIQQKM